MKNIVRLLVIGLAMLMVAGCGKKDKSVVKIGVVSPMTGAGAACVEYWVNGFKMAVEKLNEQNKDVRYEMVFEDCQSDPTLAGNCYRRLELQGIKYIVGLGGQFALAIAPMTKGKDILYFTTADYNEAVLDITDRGFRVYPSARALGVIAADYMVNDCGIKNLATITMNTVPCIQTTNAYVERVSELGASIDFQDTYDIGTYDFKNTVLKMAQKDCGGVFMNGFGISPAAFCAQMATNKKFDNITMFGDVNLATGNFAENKKNDKATIFFADAEISDEFNQLYKEQHGQDANSYVSCSYIIPILIDQARRAVGDPKDIASQLAFLRGATIETEVSDITFDERGNGEMKMAIHKLQ